MRRLASVLWGLALCVVALDGHAANISWIDTSGFVPDATTGSLPFKSGSIEISISPNAGLVTAGVESPTPFATTSARYSNIDVIPYSSLNVQPDPTGPAVAWSVEFDLTGALLEQGDAFNLGQLFVDPNQVPVTELTVSMFGPDDATPYDLALLDFEAHARAAANFDGPIVWNPATGVLSADASGAGQNSRYAFLSPTSGEIGRTAVGYGRYL